LQNLICGGGDGAAATAADDDDEFGVLQERHPVACSYLLVVTV
jgi:hypothetical protein